MNGGSFTPGCRINNKNPLFSFELNPVWKSFVSCQTLDAVSASSVTVY